MTLRLTVLGATGKMGKKILDLALNDPEFCIATPFSRQPSESDLLAALLGCDVGIDFTFHEATKNHLQAALKAGKPLVIGTTGHTEEQKKEIEEAALSIPILYSPNFSFGMALCLDAAARLGKALEGKCTIDIVETHHIHKKDSPSGTALALANACGNGKIGIQSIRTAEVIGEHTVIFQCGHERIELKHTCQSRDVFAEGALRGAKFLVKQPPGLYSFKDVLK